MRVVMATVLEFECAKSKSRVAPSGGAMCLVD